MGKWRTDASEALWSIEFWLELHIAHATRLPIGHMPQWLSCISHLGDLELNCGATWLLHVVYLLLK